MTQKAKLEWAVFAIGVIPVTVAALIVPVDVLSRSEWLSAYVAGMSIAFPVIREVSEISSFPEVTALVGAVSWTLVPIQMAMLLTRRWFIFGDGKEEKLVFRSVCVFVIIPASFVLLVYFWDVTPHDLFGGTIGAKALRAISGSRFGLGLYAGIIMTGAAWVLALSVEWCRYLKDRFT